MPLFLTEYLKRPLSQDGSLRSWAASGSPTPDPRESARKPVSTPRPPARPANGGRPERTSPRAPGAPTRPQALAHGLSHPARLRSRPHPSPAILASGKPGPRGTARCQEPSGADEPANASVPDARRGARSRTHPGMASHVRGTGSLCD